MPVLVTAIWIERLAIGLGRPGAPIRRCGMGPEKARSAGARLAAGLAPGRPVIVLGVCGALRRSAKPGQVVVAERVSVEGRETALSPDDQLTSVVVDALRRSGIRAELGAVETVRRPVWGTRRAELAASGGDVVDTETGYLFEALGARPMAAVRAVSDAPSTGLAGLPRSGLAGLAAVRRTARALGRPPLHLSEGIGY